MFKEEVFYSKFNKDAFLKYYKYEKETSEQQPLLIYIHGAGSRGDELSKMSRVGPLGEIDNGRNIPAVIVAPQCYKDTWYDLFDILTEFIENCINKKNIDKNRVYLCGVSMGGYAAWQMAMSHPEWFAAIVPVCGGGMYWNAKRLKNVPVWAFHGECDNVVFAEESVKMVKAVNANGGTAKLTLYPNVWHNSWEKAFSNDDMWDWMFSQRKINDLVTEKTSIKTGD